MKLSVIEDISVFKHEYMDMSVPALVGVGEAGEVKLRDHVGGGDQGCQMAIARLLDCLCLALQA